MQKAAELSISEASQPTFFLICWDYVSDKAYGV